MRWLASLLIALVGCSSGELETEEPGETTDGLCFDPPPLWNSPHYTCCSGGTSYYGNLCKNMLDGQTSAQIYHWFATIPQTEKAAQYRADGCVCLRVAFNYQSCYLTTDVDMDRDGGRYTQLKSYGLFSDRKWLHYWRGGRCVWESVRCNECPREF
jgi:hypothetical protein